MKKGTAILQTQKEYLISNFRETIDRQISRYDSYQKRGRDKRKEIKKKKHRLFNCIIV